MEKSSGPSFIPTNLGRVDEEMILQARGLSQATRALLATDLVILNHGQVTRTTLELVSPLLTITPTGGRLSS
ncbi:hypothetical protein TNCV_4371681 [Trichonephila clavipes]|nr:hypothetical protein TNCV_4371681 [Trichonephila clavipes]